MGVYLLFGVRRKLTSRIVLAMMLTFTSLTLYTALKGTMPDCGCFGDAVHLTPWQTLAKNLLILPCAIMLAVWPRVQARLISITNQWLVATYSWLYALVLAIYTIYTIPLIDFRPYHIGADLKLKTTWGADGTKTEGFVNTYTTHTLTLQKQVRGTFADRDRAFDFTVELTLSHKL